jgi:hypothetical protein
VPRFGNTCFVVAVMGVEQRVGQLNQFLPGEFVWVNSGEQARVLDVVETEGEGRCEAPLMVEAV